MNIGLIAHDGKKKLMQNLAVAYRGILAKHTLYATETTGRLIEDATALPVRLLLSGHVGGEQQMGAMIGQNQIDLVIFLRDPETGLLRPNGVTKAIGSPVAIVSVKNGKSA